TGAVDCFAHAIAVSREEDCSICDGRRSPCGDKDNFVVYKNNTTPIANGDFLYFDSDCKQCTESEEQLPCLRNLTNDWVTIWDSPNSGPVLFTWFLRNSPDPKKFPNCSIGACADCRASDSRLKNGIKTLSNSLNNLLKINVTEYDWNEKYTGYDFLKERQKLHSIGMIAQEINLLYPEVVYRRDDGYLAIKYYKLNSLIIEAIKSQQVFIEDIEEQINWLRTQID
ncbi:MAG: tail fiber domain-containing protein, partial [Gammaproteobacteria bacterium]|nr:tail fiber domain-containing protein [Gammaproteobacteria bacterium]